MNKIIENKHFPLIIGILFASWMLFFPPIIAILLLVEYYKKGKAEETAINQELTQLRAQLNTILNNETYKKYCSDKKYQNELTEKNTQLEKTIYENNQTISSLYEQIQTLTEKLEKLDKQQRSAQKRVSRTAEILRSIEYSIKTFFITDADFKNCKVPSDGFSELDELSPTVTLNLHSMDVKDLRKAYKQNEKDIETVLTSYVGRYTTKSNQAIYQLMVIALRAELQNILIELKYEKLEVAEEKIKATTAKYLAIASNGNQQIAGTMTKFIGQVEYLFINAAKIEYNYYVKKEQARQEQLAIREQMRIEAQERKELENEKKKIEKEESKFNDEIAKLTEQLNAAAEEEKKKLNERILQLQAQLSDVIVKKDEIVNLQNGKAGNIYIISNLGSFGEDVFKIGMTRRLDPQERINELGSASVPFKFDVHSFIFSDNAVELENKLHTILNNKRVNKVNLRKEFFRVSLDELEQLVEDIDPTAEFTRTMAAEEYRQSLSTDEVYTTDFVSDEIDEDY